MPATPRFRDPPPVETRAVELRDAIARALFDVASLPAEVPALGIAVASLDAEGPSMRLELAREGRTVLSLLLSPGADETAPLAVMPRWEGLVRSSADRNALPALIDRVRALITPERWRRIARPLGELRDLPRGVPLEAFRMLVPGGRDPEGLVRTGFNCNQDCGLCWQGRKWGRVAPDTIIAWIEDLRRSGVRHLVISGGEPTLDRELPRYLERARALRFKSICLETNAIQCARPGFARTLRDAGLTHAFVSLHSSDPRVSDAITRAPGTHARTVRGIRALLDAGVAVRLNAVITSESIGTLAHLPDFIRATFGPHRGIHSLTISDLGAAFDEALLAAMMPEPTLVRTVLPIVIERALALGIRLEGLGGPCGPAPCMFGADERVLRLRRVPEPVPFRSYPTSCDGCAVRSECYGVRPAQVERHGAVAVRPLERDRRRTISLPRRAVRAIGMF